MIAIHICAPNDENGNPQRCYAVVSTRPESNGTVLAVVDEGYEGEHALQQAGWERCGVAHERINVSVEEYRRWLTLGIVQ